MSEKANTEELQEEQKDGTEEVAAEEVVTEEVEAPVEKTLEEQLAEAKAEAAELKDSMLRVAAESENFKKRMSRESAATLKYAGENIFKEILPAVDNLERAVAHSAVEGVEAEQNLKSLQEGVELTLKSLLASLEKFEVKAIESIGKPFDPVHQEALTMEASDTLPANHVVNEFEKGYYYKDRLLRPAKVIVSSGAK